MLAQTYTYTTNNSGRSAVFFVVWFAIAIGLACIPAFIASHKGRPWVLWFVFGFFCFLPALIVSIVIQDRSYGAAGYPPWQPQQPAAPPGWYPDPGGSGSQRYWDGRSWTEHLH